MTVCFASSVSKFLREEETLGTGPEIQLSTNLFGASPLQYSDGRFAKSGVHLLTTASPGVVQSSAASPGVVRRHLASPRKTRSCPEFCQVDFIGALQAVTAPSMGVPKSVPLSVLRTLA